VQSAELKATISTAPLAMALTGCGRCRHIALEPMDDPAKVRHVSNAT